MRASAKPVRPRVTALCWSSWDGRMMALGGALSPPPAVAQCVVRMLAGADAVMESALAGGVGFMDAGWLNELLREARLALGESACPLSVVVGWSGGVKAHGLRTGASAPRVVYSAEPMSADAVKAFAGVAEVRAGGGGEIQPAAVLRSLAGEFGVCSLVAVGGGNFLRSLLQAGCVDELCLILEPRIAGNKGGETLTGTPGGYLPASVQASLSRMEEVGGECVTWWKLRYGREFAEKVDALELMA